MRCRASTRAHAASTIDCIDPMRAATRVRAAITTSVPVAAVRQCANTAVAVGVPAHHRSRNSTCLAARLIAGDGGEARFSLTAPRHSSRAESRPGPRSRPPIPVRRCSGGKRQLPSAPVHRGVVPGGGCVCHRRRGLSLAYPRGGRRFFCTLPRASCGSSSTKWTARGRLCGSGVRAT
jgi:hypothetical protein